MDDGTPTSGELAFNASLTQEKQIGHNTAAIAELARQVVDLKTEVAAIMETLTKITANQVTLAENVELTMRSQMHAVQKGSHGKEENQPEG